MKFIALTIGYSTRSHLDEFSVEIHLRLMLNSAHDNSHSKGLVRRLDCDHVTRHCGYAHRLVYNPSTP